MFTLLKRQAKPLFALIISFTIAASLQAAEPQETATTEEIAARRALLQEAKRVLFLGDSITYSGLYVTNFEVWLQRQDWSTAPHIINTGLSSETVSGLSEEGHAGGRFPRPDLAERIDRVLETVKPDLIFACYGINCGIVQPFDEGHFQKYQAGIKQLRKKAEAAGAKIIHITPPLFDDQVAKKDFSYDYVMHRYAEWLIAQRAHGWNVIDLHGAMAAEVKKRRVTNPQFTFQPDSVHPNSAGHWLMAAQLISWFGDSETASLKEPQAMLADLKQPSEILKAAHSRMGLLRNAYLTTAGHTRPGVPKGLSIPEAEKQAEVLSHKLDKLLQEKR